MLNKHLSISVYISSLVFRNLWQIDSSRLKYSKKILYILRKVKLENKLDEQYSFNKLL